VSHAAEAISGGFTMRDREGNAKIDVRAISGASKCRRVDGKFY